jgi:hypothetical protein
MSDVITYLVQIKAFLYDQYDQTSILVWDEVEAILAMGLDMEMIL